MSDSCVESKSVSNALKFHIYFSFANALVFLAVITNC